MLNGRTITSTASEKGRLEDSLKIVLTIKILLFVISPRIELVENNSLTFHILKDYLVIKSLQAN